MWGKQEERCVLAKICGWARRLSRAMEDESTAPAHKTRKTVAMIACKPFKTGTLTTMHVLENYAGVLPFVGCTLGLVTHKAASGHLRSSSSGQ